MNLPFTIEPPPPIEKGGGVIQLVAHFNSVVSSVSSLSTHWGGGDVAQLVEHRTGTPLTQVRFPGAARGFSSRVNFQCRLSYGVRTPPVCNRMH